MLCDPARFRDLEVVFGAACGATMTIEAQETVMRFEINEDEHDFLNMSFVSLASWHEGQVREITSKWLFQKSLSGHRQLRIAPQYKAGGSPDHLQG